MLNLIEWACVLGVIASVSAPLLYAVATLDGLQHKTVYLSFGSFTTADAWSP